MGDPRDTQRLIGDMLQLGTVTSVDLAEGTCRVQIGDLETGDVPWLTGSAGETRIWCPPSIGEQVLLVAPEGDTLAGLVLRGLPSNDNPAAGDAKRVVIRFGDDAIIAYDPEEHLLEAILPGGGKAKVTAPGGIELMADVKVQGNLQVTGDVTIDGKADVAADVKAGDISLQHHKHGLVKAGTDKSGVPE
jgi:phage baseplate assembly protein V